MSYIIEEKEERVLLGLKHRQLSTEDNKIGKLWDTFFNDYDKKVDKKSGKYYGFEHHPAEFDESGDFYYYACAEINDDNLEIEGLDKIFLPEGEYVKFPVKFHNLNEEIRRIYNDEIKKIDEFEIIEGFSYEEYLEDFDHRDENSTIYLAFLIKR